MTRQRPAPPMPPASRSSLSLDASSGLRGATASCSGTARTMPTRFAPPSPHWRGRCAASLPAGEFDAGEIGLLAMSQMVVACIASSDFYLVVVFARFSLFVVAVVFLALGVMSLIAPMILTPLVGIALPTPIALMEVRGVYGGLFLGVGMFFFLSARRNDWLRPGLVAQASVFGGFVVGRTVGMAIGGAPNAFI